MKRSFILLLMVPLFSISQGVRFQHGLSWAQVKAKAKAEKKFIFMDAFTTWCGPCRYMSTTVFPQEQVGSVLNSNFINVKVQLDTTKNDDAEVKSWYMAGHTIMHDYKVNVFPTYLFFDPNGKLVHRAIGASEAAEFTAKVKDALNPETQYYTLLKKYRDGYKDEDFMRKMAVTAKEMYDSKNASDLSRDYLRTQKDLFTKENASFITKLTGSTKDTGFTIILNNPAAFDQALGEGTANKILTDLIANDELYPVIFKDKQGAPNWDAITATLTQKYPAQAAEVISAGKVAYYQQMQDWGNFQKSIQDYMSAYGANVTPVDLNNYAWTVFENCKDMTCVTSALEWSKRSFKDNNDPMFMDTYANILYKMGRKDEAVEWEAKALALVSEDQKQGYQATLDKMKKGEKTWKE